MASSDMMTETFSSDWRRYANDFTNFSSAGNMDFNTLVDEWLNSSNNYGEDSLTSNKYSDFDRLVNDDKQNLDQGNPGLNTIPDFNTLLGELEKSLEMRISGFENLESLEYLDSLEHIYDVNELPLNSEKYSFISDDHLKTPVETRLDIEEHHHKDQKNAIDEENENRSDNVIEADNIESLLEKFETTEFGKNVLSNNLQKCEFFSENSSMPRLSPDASTNTVVHVGLYILEDEHNYCLRASHTKDILEVASAHLLDTEENEFVSNPKIAKNDQVIINLRNNRSENHFCQITPSKKIKQTSFSNFLAKKFEVNNSQKYEFSSANSSLPRLPSGASSNTADEHNYCFRATHSENIVVEDSSHWLNKKGGKLIANPTDVKKPQVVANLRNTKSENNNFSLTPLEEIKQTHYGHCMSEKHKYLPNHRIVRNSDGRLMISIPKINNIRHNLDENYKKKPETVGFDKHRVEFTNPTASSVSNLQMVSHSKTQISKDKNTDMLILEENAQKMSPEWRNTLSKSFNDISRSTPIYETSLPKPNKKVQPNELELDEKTHRSIGVNTGTTEKKFLTQAEKLEDLKNLLKGAQFKYSTISVINSLMESIPKDNTVEKNEEYGPEIFKTCTPKIRKLPETRSIGVQTSSSTLGYNKKRSYSRRNSSSSSSSSSYELKSYRRSSFRTRSRSESRSPPPLKKRKREYIEDVKGKRLICVGNISQTTTERDLHRRFSKFGNIRKISLFTLENREHYGFVTFEHHYEAYDAIEHGNDDPNDVQYNLSFGR